MHREVHHHHHAWCSVMWLSLLLSARILGRFFHAEVCLCLPLEALLESSHAACFCFCFFFSFKPLIAFQAHKYIFCLTSSPCLLDAWPLQSTSSCSNLDELLWVSTDLSPCDVPYLPPDPGQVPTFFAFTLSA